MTVTDPIEVWDNVAIGAGAASDPVPCSGYVRKTLYFLTSLGGDITVEVDPTGRGGWMTLYGEAAIGVRAATNPWMFSTEYVFVYLRVTFSAAATVTLIVARGT